MEPTRRVKGMENEIAEAIKNRRALINLKPEQHRNSVANIGAGVDTGMGEILVPGRHVLPLRFPMMVMEISDDKIRLFFGLANAVHNPRQILLIHRAHQLMLIAFVQPHAEKIHIIVIQAAVTRWPPGAPIGPEPRMAQFIVDFPHCLVFTRA